MDFAQKDNEVFKSYTIVFLYTEKNSYLCSGIMLWDLFISFFKIGTFTIGGGFAMIPLMEKELVEKHHWLDEKEFMDLISISQTMPGVFAVNMATSVGFSLRGWKGAAMAIMGNIIVPIGIIILCAVGFRTLHENVIVERIFMGLRPAVVALIAAPVFKMGKTAKVTWHNCWIPVAAAGLIWLCGISPIWIILSALCGGFIYYRFIRREK